MAHVVLNACGETSTTTGDGALTLANTAPANYGALQTLDTAITNGDAANSDTVDYHILDADETAWETGRGTITNSTTLTRTTVYRSTNSDNAVSLSAGTHTILFSPSAMALTAPRGHIEFDVPNFLSYTATQVAFNTNTSTTVDNGDTTNLTAGMYVSGTDIPDKTTIASITNGTTFELSQAATGTTVGTTLAFSHATDINVAAGRGWIDDEYLSWTAAQASSLAHTFAAEGLHQLYLYNNSGTVDLEVVSADNGMVWDTDRGFYVKSGDTARRWIGWVLVYQESTDSTYRIAPFAGTCVGRLITIAYTGERYNGSNFLTGEDYKLVNDTGRTAAIYSTAFDFQPVLGDLTSDYLLPTTPLVSWLAAIKLNATTGTSDDGIVSISPTQQSTGIDAAWMHYSVRAQPGSTGKTFFGRYQVPYDNTGGGPFYAVSAVSGTIDAEIECWGGSALI